MGSQASKAPFLFEASWEVCNKVGGIHTVLTTKLARAQNLFADRYITVGPWLAQNPTFHEEPAPAAYAKQVELLARQGVIAHYGHWLTDGQPATVLLDWQGLVPQLNTLKARYWEQFKLDSLNTDFYDVDQPLLWSTAVGMFVAALAETFSDPVLFHGHEWLSAGAFLTLYGNKKVQSVFTTHATVLGRALSSDGTDIYSRISDIQPDEAAKTRNVVTKHQLEKLAAQNATIFTTVSSLTGREATAFLGKTPDVITENGVDPELFPAFDALCLHHEEMREELHDFISAYFFPSYRFNLSETSYVFTMGRYEMHNKGYDVALESLAQLNEKLKKEKSSRTVIGCFFVPGDSVGVRPEVLFQRSAYNHIAQLLSHYTSAQQRELYSELWSEEEVSQIEVLPPHARDQIKQLILRLPIYEKVPLSPFQLRHPDQDSILNTAKQFGLENTAEDRVKILFFPAYFDGFDGLFNKMLYDLINGCDLGVFPSCYEPWGYTPMESLAMAVPAVTSDLAGFGIALEEHAERHGSYILKREGLSDTETATALTSYLVDFLNLTSRQQLLRRMQCYEAIQAFSWNILYAKYEESYDKALHAHPSRS